MYQFLLCFSLKYNINILNCWLNCQFREKFYVLFMKIIRNIYVNNSFYLHIIKICHFDQFVLHFNETNQNNVMFCF